MIVIKGEGELMIDVKSGDIEVVYDCTPLKTWCELNGYHKVSNLEGQLNLDEHRLPLPECNQCSQHDECCSYEEELDPLICSAWDEKATSESILSALAALSDEERNEVLCQLD